MQVWLRRYRFRSWIRHQLREPGGDKYFEMLERDIGVQRGYFKEQATKFVFEE